MKTLEEFVKQQNYKDNLTFEKYISDNNLIITKNNKEDLWFDYESFKYENNSVYSKYVGYTEYQNYIYDFLYEDIKQFKKEVENNWKDKFVNFLRRQKKSLIESVWMNDRKYTLKLKFRKPFDISEIEKLCDQFNVFVSNYKEELLYVVVFIEENDMPDVTKYVYQKTNGILYHITTKENTENILKYGLEPRSEKKKSWHPERIYFVDFNSSQKQIETLKKELYNDLNNLVILKIDLNKQPQYRIKFFEDPQCDICDDYYTCESIPVTCISKIKNVNLDKIIVNVSRLWKKIIT